MAKLQHLQGIRGIAICAVTAFHYFPQYFPNGYLGVDVFFVLSGYLMSMMLARHSSLTGLIIVDFIYRRLKRITPLYYLVIFLTTIGIQFCSCSELFENLYSSRNAAYLVTNILWTMQTDYFTKLGVSHDLFTHTWSLCLEMQFYFLFPLLWALQSKLEIKQKLLFLQFISGISLFYYFMADEKTAFNSVCSRIWQFLFGNIIFCLEPIDEEKSLEKVPLIIEYNNHEFADNKQLNQMDSANWIFASFSLILLAYSIVTEHHLSQDYSRMTITITAVILIYFGRGFLPLENMVITFLGEISYSWYLIHWPMITYQKMEQIDSPPKMAIGLAISFVIAIFAHYFIEKNYLKLENKLAVISIVLVLFVATLSTNAFIKHNATIVKGSKCSEDPALLTNYKIMSKEALKEYNKIMFDFDQIQLKTKGCVKGDAFPGSCRFDPTNANNSKTLLILGNSWAANVSPIIYEECRHIKNIYRTAGPSCEVFYESQIEWCQGYEKMYITDVNQIKPDYLFLLERYVFWGVKRNEFEWKARVEFAKQRMAIISSLVKEKIFILHTFPTMSMEYKALNDAMDTGIPPNITSTEANNFDMSTAQIKLDEVIAASCPKCHVIDYTPIFQQDGVLLPYDPKYFVAYFTKGLHLTQPGLEKVRPLYNNICRSL